MKWLLGVVLCAAAALPAAAQRGAGGLSCGQYVQAYDRYQLAATTRGPGAEAAIANFAQYESWIEGYLFGVRSWDGLPTRAFDRAGLQLWVYNYCQMDPLDVVANAALAFYRSIAVSPPTAGDR
jgi:hypothetical protein